MLISVCLCTFNGEKYLPELLMSLVNQSRIPDEIVIYDDCSTDSTLTILKDFQKKYSQINWRIFVQSCTQGWRINFHDALSLAMGDFIFLCDQDDIWDSQKIKNMMLAMETHPKALLIACSYEIQYDSEKAIKTIVPKIDGRILKLEKTKNFMSPKRPGCTYSLKKELVGDFLKVWDPSFAHDAMLWRIAYLKDGLYIYNFKGIIFRRHDDNASSFYGGKFSTEKFNNRYNGIVMSIKCLSNLFKININPKMKSLLQRKYSFYKRRLQAYNSLKLNDLILLVFLFYKYDSLKIFLLDVMLLFNRRLRFWTKD